MRWVFLLWHLRLHNDADALEPDSSLHSTGELPLKHTNELSNNHWLLTGKVALLFCDYLNERNKWCQRSCHVGIQMKPSFAFPCVSNEGAAALEKAPSRAKAEVMLWEVQCPKSAPVSCYHCFTQTFLQGRLTQTSARESETWRALFLPSAFRRAAICERFTQITLW